MSRAPRLPTGRRPEPSRTGQLETVYEPTHELEVHGAHQVGEFLRKGMERAIGQKAAAHLDARFVAPGPEHFTSGREQRPSTGPVACPAASLPAG